MCVYIESHMAPFVTVAQVASEERTWAMDLSIVPEKETAEDCYERRFELKRELGILYSRLAPSSRKYITADAVVEAFENPGTPVLLADGAPVKLDYLATLRRQAMAISPKLTVEREMVRWRGGYRNYNHEFTVTLLAEPLHDRTPVVVIPVDPHPEFKMLEFGNFGITKNFTPDSGKILYFTYGYKIMDDGSRIPACYVGSTTRELRSRIREHMNGSSDRPFHFIPEGSLAWELPEQWAMVQTEGEVSLIEDMLIYTMNRTLAGRGWWLDNRRYNTKVRCLTEGRVSEVMHMLQNYVYTLISQRLGFALDPEPRPKHGLETPYYLKNYAHLYSSGTMGDRSARVRGREVGWIIQ